MNLKSLICKSFSFEPTGKEKRLLLLCSWLHEWNNFSIKCIISLEKNT